MFIKRLSPTHNALIFALVLPLATFAQNSNSATTNDICKNGVSDFTSFMGYLIQCIIATTLVKVAVAIAVVVFMVGIIRYMWRAADGDASYGQNLRQYLGWSIIAFFVMLSLWGIIYAVGATVGIGQGGTAPIPQLPT